MRYSKQREAIRTYMEGRHDHPTADNVYAAVREKLPNISLGTVYRNLMQLVDAGELQVAGAVHAAGPLRLGDARGIRLGCVPPVEARETHERFLLGYMSHCGV